MNKPPAPSSDDNKKGDSVKVQAVQYSGPLPPPGALEHYDRIVPGFAERLLAQFEQESQHTRELDRAIIRNEIRAGYLGQIFAFITALVGLIGAVYAAINGAQWAATVIGGGTLAMIISAFLLRKNPSSSGRRN